MATKKKAEKLTKSTNTTNTIKTPIISSRINSMLDKVKSIRISRRKFIIIMAIIAVIGVWRYFAYKNGGIQVTEATVRRDDLVESISASGSVNAEKLAMMYFPTGGKLAWLNVTEGQTVKKYQALAALDRTILDSAYQQARSAVRKYEATVDYVHDSLKGKDTSETFAERDTRTTAEVAKDSAYDSLRIAEYNIKNAVLYAPFDGVATSFAQGMAVGANIPGVSPAMIVVDPTTVYFQSQVGEIDVMKVKPGLKTEIVFDAYPNDSIATVIKTVDFASITTSTGGTAYKVNITLPVNNDMKFRLGMNGDAKFILSEKKNVLMVPQNAIVEENDKTYVFVIENGKAIKKEVKLGVYSTDDAEVISGLSEGEKVVERPSSKLTSGSRVKIK